MTLGLEVWPPSIKVTSFDSEWGKNTLQKPIVLVFIGSCASCVAKELMAWQVVHDKWLKRLGILVISRDSQEQIDEFVKETGFTLPIISDSDGSLTKAYNAIWVPRVYGIDKKGNLTWIEKEIVSKQSPEGYVQAIWATMGSEQP